MIETNKTNSTKQKKRRITSKTKKKRKKQEVQIKAILFDLMRKSDSLTDNQEYWVGVLTESFMNKKSLTPRQLKVLRDIHHSLTRKPVNKVIKRSISRKDGDPVKLHLVDILCDEGITL